jgi:BirA family transcriptional regulator, biotin operon repressor / biotin---[acetyl-CoA-carboxylase] ligase
MSKEKIIEILKDSDQPISGQEISRHLNVSRVAVWKHIGQLKNSGFEIESSAKGYSLIAIPDTPFPWMFAGRSARIHYFPELGSTMDTAMQLARNGCPPFTVVIADRQVKGRGRLQRMWQSEAGGLYFSIVLRPVLIPTVCPVINFAAALDLVETLEHCCQVRADVKWPNDVLVNGRKIAGILAQMEAEAEKVSFINIGIGLNVNNNPICDDKPAVSVLQLTGCQKDRAQILADFLDRFENRMADFSRKKVMAAWKLRNITLGRRVKVVTVRDSVEGLALDVDENGGLILESEDGSHHTVLYGDCFHQV